MLLLLSLETPSSDILHDPIFQFIVGNSVTLLAGIIGVLATIWVFRKGQSKKEISYQIISYAPVVSIEEELESRVEILLDGKPIKNAWLIVIKLWNSGNVAVRRDDYDELITFEFVGAEVVSSEVLSTRPENIISINDAKTFLISQQNYIKFPKFLLNAKQSIRFSTLVIGNITEINTGGRLVDGDIVPFDPDTQPAVVKISTVIFGAIFVYIILSIGFYVFDLFH